MQFTKYHESITKYHKRRSGHRVIYFIIRVFCYGTKCVKASSSRNRSSHMQTIAETTHSRTITAFHHLTSIALACGTAFNPPRTSYKLSVLTSQLASARADHQELAHTKNRLEKVIRIREAAFKQIPSLTSRILQEVSTIQASATTSTKVRMYARHIQNKKKLSTAEGSKRNTAIKKRKTILTRHNHQKVIEYFHRLIETVTREVNYLPTEIDIKIIILNMVLHEIRGKHSAVVFAQAALSDARLALDKSIYAPHIGLIDTGIEVKNYLKTIISSNHPMHKELLTLKFSRRTYRKIPVKIRKR